MKQDVLHAGLAALALTALGIATQSFAAQSAPVFALSQNPKSAPAGAYTVEPSHTSVAFAVSHLGLAAYAGRFNTIDGTLSFNGAEPQKSRLSITIDLGSIDTPSDVLDDKLKKEVFKTDVNKTAAFKSTAIKVTGERKGEITGDLTLNGVTKPVTLIARFNGGLMHPFAQAYVLGFDAEAKFKRSDFGLNAWATAVGDEVTLVIAAEFTHNN